MGIRTVSQTINLDSKPEQVVSKYITKIDNAGIKVHAYNDSSNTTDTNNYVQITSDGMTVIKSTIPVAQFGETIRLGSATSNNVLIDSDSVVVRDGTTELANFGASGTVIGKIGEQRIRQTASGLEFIDENGTTTAMITLVNNKVTIRNTYTNTRAVIDGGFSIIGSYGEIIVVNGNGDVDIPSGSNYKIGGKDPYFFVIDTYTLSSGAFSITDSRITANTAVFVSEMYTSALGAKSYHYTVQPLSGVANIYVRTSTGATATGQVKVCVLFVNA